MERVKNVMQRLQEVYYGKHQKSAIDIDLMLDYTRVMYADLLEWRRQFGDPPTTENAEANKEVVTSEAAKETAAAEDAEPVQEPVEPAVEAEQAMETEADVIKPEPPPEPVVDTAAPSDKAYKPIEHDDPAPKEPIAESTPVIETEPEKEYIEVLQQDATGISFEPPTVPEARMDIQEELLIEEPAVNPVVEEIAAPAPAAIPLPEMTPVQEQKPRPVDLFASAGIPKDVRSVIGINDKYLFLNELFNNHKSNYEETLDQLNHFSTLQQAEDWIDTRVAAANKWDKSDPTVEGFYAILQRHFSER